MVINHQTQLLNSVIRNCHALTRCSLTACNLNLNVKECMHFRNAVCCMHIVCSVLGVRNSQYRNRISDQPENKSFIMTVIIFKNIRILYYPPLCYEDFLTQKCISLEHFSANSLTQSPVKSMGMDFRRGCQVVKRSQSLHQSALYKNVGWESPLFSFPGSPGF